jgi:glutamate dehydrogenase
VRVDAGELRLVVGEGGNLGFTQRGAASSSRWPAGGSTPTHRQLGRRRLLGPRGQHQDPAERRGARGELTRKQRNKLLAEMTDEVAELVL